MKKYHIFRTLLILTIAFFYLETKAQTFPVTNLLIHGWEKIDALNFGTLDTSIYKTILWNSSDHKFYKIGGYNSTTGKDSLFVSYCSGCAMTTGWKLNGDTLKIDTSYVNKIIKDSLNAHWIALNGLIQDTANIVHWSDTTSIIATKHDVDTLSNSVYDSLSNHYDLIHGLDTGKVSTSGDIMYGDLNVNADVHADTVHATVKQSVYLNSLASWDSQGVLNDTIIPNNVSDPLYNKIVAIRPNKPDTSFTSIDLIANTTLFPKGTYFHVYKGSYTATVNLARDSCVFYLDDGVYILKTNAGAVFDYSGATYKNDIYILGNGNVSHTTTSGQCFIAGTSNPNALKIYLSGNIFSATNSDAICIDYTTKAIQFDIEVKYPTSSGGYAIYHFVYNSTSYGNIIKFNYALSTSTAAIFSASNNTTTYGSYARSTATYGVYGYTAIGEYYIGYCYGATYGYYVANYATIVGNTNSIYAFGNAEINFTGNCQYLTATGNSRVVGGNFNYITCSGSNESSVYANYTTKNGGWAIENYSGGFNVSSGNLTISGNYYFISTAYGTITGGRVTMLSDLYFEPYYNYPYFDLSGTGTLILKNHINFRNSNLKAPLIKKTGGTLILDGCVIYKQSQYSTIIQASASPQDIKIISCATNGINGDLLSAKARRDSVLITAVTQPTTIYILGSTGGGSSEIFTSTLNTSKADIAADLVSKINASSTCYATATQTGDSFVLEAKTPSVDYSFSSWTSYWVNCTDIQLRLNSYGITDIVGGSIIEDSDVSY